MRQSDEVLTATEVAELAKVSRTTVWRWIHEGRLPTAMMTPGGHRRFRRADVDRLLAPGTDDAA